jgi:hypothetical protein
MPNESLIPSPLTASVVRSYIDFDGHQADTSHGPSVQARLQSEGVAGLWELLRQQDFAYLADEVGMGKTRQAMGVIATQFLAKPDSRIVIVCSSAVLQRQWQSEWSQFLRTCYRLLDDRLLASTDAAQLEELHLHQNLRDFARALRAGDARIHLLRYSSFSRPLSLGANSPSDLLEEYAEVVGASVEALRAQERALAVRHAGQSDGWADSMRHQLAAAYCGRISRLLTHGTQRGADGRDEARVPLDLAVFDEAQYLRHTGNFQNRHIASIFRRNVQRWLFLSATPLHSSAHDIRSLDAYLCRRAPQQESADRPPLAPVPGDCGGCGECSRCPQLTWRLAKQPGTRPDVVDVLGEMMIRRTRTYADGDGKRYGKVAYRRYDKVRHSGADDPFLALTMALVQKRLVGALAGRNNRFRQGECASFESLSSSVGRTLRPAAARVADSEALKEYEPVADDKHEGEPRVALDRNVIDGLNRSFIRAMPMAAGHGLPHAKLHRTVDELFDRSLRDGSVEKTLVFVRRIDTVEEMRDLLHVKFQREVDGRILAWRELLAGEEFAGTADLWQGDFWTDQRQEPDGAVDEDPDDALDKAVEQDDDAPDAGAATHNRGFREQTSLAYFEALKKRSGTKERHGKLVSFRTRLLVDREKSRSPLRGFLLAHPGEASELGWGSQEDNKAHWRRLLAALLGTDRVDELADTPAHRWLFADTATDGTESYRLAALQLCLLQVMRQTDFLVDLYILHNHLLRTPGGASTLVEKLLWLFECEAAMLPSKLALYVANVKTRFRHWVEHFDLIVDKCFRSGGAADWATIFRDRVSPAFRLMAPVIGRSGRIANIHAVSQFKFPSHPNILICTDVLKEGVDMHLFCDRVVHYGVAWTSGDLEQRIGRVDRLGSLISRKLQLHRAESAAPAPRLDVAFPYLDGTLDKYQVNRVIREKIVSDQRMDLGKRKDELGEVELSDLSADESLPVVPVEVRNKGGGVFFPPEVFARVSAEGEVLHLPPGIRLKNASDVVGARTRIDEGADETRISLPDWEAVLIRRAASRREDALRCTTTKTTKKEGPELLWTEELIVVRGFPLHGSPAAELAGHGGPYGVPRPPTPAFAFSAVLNTSVATVPAGDVGAASDQDTLVRLESIGEAFWLLRCFVQPVEACDVKSRRNGLQLWLAERNAARTFGYLMEDGRDVWFGLVVRKAEGAELPLLERLVPRVARMALFYRRRTVDPRSGLRRALTAFPRATQHPDWTKLMKQNDVLACGQMLTGVQAWFEEAFEAVLGELYGPNVPAAARGLTTQPLTFLPGGVLHLVAQGAEHFALQAFLDLSGIMHGNGMPKGPGIWWELVVSPNFKGRKPRLPSSGIEELPHALADIWETEVRDDSAACTCIDERDYRFLAMRHAPAAWDRARSRMLQAWGEAFGKMRELSKFQRVQCRDVLIEATESGGAEVLEQ